MPTKHWTTLEQLFGCHSKTASAMAPGRNFKKKERQDFSERSQLLTYQGNFKKKLTYDSPPWGLSHGFITSRAESLIAKVVQRGPSIHVPCSTHSESSYMYSFVKKEEEGRITFKRKSKNLLYTAVGEARRNPYKLVRASEEDSHSSDILKTFPWKLWPAAGAQQSDGSGIGHRREDLLLVQ